jgi:hypothetical protein
MGRPIKDLGLARVRADRFTTTIGACPWCRRQRGHIKLRDLPDNLWNADTLFVLTENHAQARDLARIAEEEDWGGEVYVYENQDDIDGALGTGRDEYGLLTVWWD